jgi:AcrR family transcriptional regulator
MTTNDTEKTILDAARKVFLLKGFAGARMQEIADEAKINKALLHYYFRSKDKLFDAIFEEALHGFFPNIINIMQSELRFEEKISKFVDQYLNLLKQNPSLPAFILQEAHRSPEKIAGLMKKNGIDSSVISNLIKKNKKDKDSDIPIEHIMVNIISLCVFPFAGKPIIEMLLFNGDEKKYKSFIAKRGDAIKAFVLHGIMN